MDNPFLRRATEFLRDDEAFLAIVTPEPVKYFLQTPGKSGRLYDRLVLLRGTPGSGKTTLARLFEFSTLKALLRNSTIATFQPLVAALQECGALCENGPAVLGCRLPLETDYRDFWEFPYNEALKLGLMNALIQARAVLTWIRHLRSQNIDLENVQIISRTGAEGVLPTIGGSDCEALATRARDVEQALYGVMGALIAPVEVELPPEATGAYQPFDVIESFRIQDGRVTLDLCPLVILDDAHVLHPTQFEGLQRWLTRRELRIARWVISRFDTLQPEEALNAAAYSHADAVHYPGLSVEREAESILLQSSGARRENRVNFRRMAKDMAGRYLKRMPLMNSRGLVNLGELLSDTEPVISQSQLARLERSVASAQRKLGISDERRSRFEKDIASYKDVQRDMALSMLMVMMYRHDKRRPEPGPELFPDFEPEPSKPVRANPSVFEAARIHLLHRCERPYFFGVDALCDASSENAEQFLQLAAILVDTVATQLIKGQSASLTPATQNKLLRKRGGQIVSGWNFPQHRLVRRLTSQMGEKCREVSLQANGWLVPNAFGIPKEDIERMKEVPELAQTLKYAIAYNALTLVPDYPCKDREWYLLELGGMLALHHGLTLKRGGFVESTLDELARMIEGDDA